MTEIPRSLSSDWIRTVAVALRERPDIDSMEALHELCERLVPLAWREDRPRLESFAAAGDAGRFRRHPLAVADAPRASALLIYWPPGHATLSHDHDGLPGIELVVDGALEVDEFVRIGDAAHPTLALSRSLYLGVGDAAVFSGETYVHRCRNLSATRAALSLHVYGGALDAYRTFVADAAGRYRAREEFARTDSSLG